MNLKKVEGKKKRQKLYGLKVNLMNARKGHHRNIAELEKKLQEAKK